MANIKVAVRIRPISEREMNITGADIVVHTDGSEVSLTNLKVSASKAGDSRKRTRRYGFDYCFNSSSLDSEAHATQEKVYEKLGRSALDALFSGFNACLVAYGQSASGKTYTMMGPKNDPGLTPRLCEGLFFRISEEEKMGDCYETAVSYLEIYNERVRDLLKPSTNTGGLRVREHPRLGPYVQGLTRHRVSTLGSLMSYVEEGTRARKTASTSQNPTSSRSHALLTVSLTSRSENSCSPATTNGLEKKQHGGRGARLHLVDLAGSERAGNSNYGLHRLKEGANINKSLVALGNVISALAERGATGSGPGRRFIPYRDSALTWLLKDALGGNATTIMLATISPASGSYNETAHTLRFAQRAQSVVNRPVVNEDPVSRVIRELRAEISRLTSLLFEKGLSGEDRSSCCCKSRPEVEESLVNVQKEEEESIVSANDEKPELNKLAAVDHRASSFSVSTFHRRYSSDDSLPSNRLLEDNEGRSLRRSGSLKSLDSPSEKTVDFRKECSRARLSSVSYDRVNGLALVDIPTLVAVLIKPDDNPESGSVQIEEISVENIIEGSVDAEISEPDEEVPGPDFGPKVITPVEGRPEEEEAEEPPAKETGKVPEDYRSKERLGKEDLTGLIEEKKSSNLKNSKRFGSSESFESLKRTERNGLVQRSYTTLQLERSRQSTASNSLPGKAKRNWSPRGSTGAPLRRVESGEKDAAKKSLPDVERAQEVRQQKARNPLRKQDSDSPKRKVSKEGNLSREEPALASCPKFVRKGSVPGETTSRTQTPIQRTNRRAEIVAAVTERLYSTKKAPEEGPVASPEFRSPESTEVKLANGTRMKLQEISRKMLAKRRRTCVDTQTDAASTIRVKDTASVTDSTEVETRDAEIMTEVQEDCRGIGAGDSPLYSVTRVKEIATLTERFARTVRCKDVGILTEDYEDDCTPGVLQTDTSPRLGNPVFAETSTNTASATSPKRCAASQTVREDVSTGCKKPETGCSGCHAARVSCCQATAAVTDRNVICITLPDMLSITIESPNSLESKIAVTEAAGILAADDKVLSKLKDGVTQTENQDGAKNADSVSKANCVAPGDSSATVTTRSAACQSDGKTFRIENIFEDPKNAGRTTDRGAMSDLLPDLTEHVVPKTSLKLTNSVGTSFTPETAERSTEIEGFNFQDQKATDRWTDASWRELANLRFFGTTRKGPCAGSSPLPVSRPVPSPILSPKNESSKYQTGMNAASVPRQTVAKIEAEELKSPLLVARLISNNSVEMDSCFSDDSLDPDELGLNTPGKSPAILRPDDSLCPPDVVAHTKKELYDSRIEEDFVDEVVEFPRSSVNPENNTSRVHDYEALVLGRNCFIPICQESGDTGRIETPESEEGRNNFKKKVSFSNSKLPGRPQANDTRKPKPIIKNKPNTFASTPLDCSTSENSFRDDISSISGSSETMRSGTLDNSDEESDAESRRVKREDSDMKRVRFTPVLFAGERVESVDSSDSEGCENAISDDESYCCETKGCGGAPHTVFASYLDEATAFVHNMNTMNDYVNASRLFMRRENDRDDDYIEYKGCRISLRDDTDEYLKPEEFNVPVDSYRNCLRGIAKLENCIEKAVRHDELLLDKYGIRLESAATSYSLVEPGKDSVPSRNPGANFADLGGISGLQNPGGDLGSSVEDLAGITDEESVEETRPRHGEESGNFENAVFEHLMESASPRRRNACGKPYFRRTTRVSDLSEKGPRLRKKYRETGTYPDHESLEDSKWYTAPSGPGSLQSSPEVVKDADLKVPQCFLMVPDTGRPGFGNEYRIDGGSAEAVGTSSESVDTVASVRNKFRYPGSPRAKLLQLVSERRQIVHRSRNASPR